MADAGTFCASNVNTGEVTLTRPSANASEMRDEVNNINLSGKNLKIVAMLARPYFRPGGMITRRLPGVVVGLGFAVEGLELRVVVGTRLEVLGARLTGGFARAFATISFSLYLIVAVCAAPPAPLRTTTST